MEILLALGIAMFAGLFLSRLTSKFNLPDVTSYLVAGVLVGPLVLGRLGVPGLGFSSIGGITFNLGSAAVTLSGLAIAAIAGVALNALLPGNDYEFGSNELGDTAVNFGTDTYKK